MAFIDFLSSQLLVLLLTGVSGLYLLLKTYLSMRRGTGLNDEIGAGWAPFMLFGIFAFITGLYGALTWPLPGSYNILFYDVYTLFGLLLIFWAWSFYKGSKLEYVGFVSLLVGIATIYYGVSGFNLGLTRSPDALMYMYSAFGAAGVLSYPCAMILDKTRASRNYLKNHGMALLMLALFALALIIACAVTAIVVVPTIPAHLANAP